MTGMILAAGLGTRLRPITHTTPKALVQVGGVPLIERVARRVLDAGAERLVINTSHLGEQVEAYVRGRDGWGVDVQFSPEPDGPLETGGGLKKAALLFPPGDPVLIHNADILTTIDLGALVDRHQSDPRAPLATLAVTEATSDRFLTFDDAGLLGYAADGEPRAMRDADGEARRVDFCGVHVVSPELLSMVTAEKSDRFSIMDTYLRLAKEGRYLAAFGGEHECLDVGTHERLAEAEQRFAGG